MKKIRMALRETLHLIKTHKLYFLMPLMMLFCMIGFLFFQYGPGILITFIYAGV